MNFCPDCGAKREGKFCEECGYAYPEQKIEPEKVEKKATAPASPRREIDLSSPAWFPDPIRSGRERLWDGSQWTDEVRPGPKGFKHETVGLGPRLGGEPVSPNSSLSGGRTDAVLAIEIPTGLVYGKKFNAKKNCLNCGFKKNSGQVCDRCGYEG